jgi:hypothetical protein
VRSLIAGALLVALAGCSSVVAGAGTVQPGGGASSGRVGASTSASSVPPSSPTSIGTSISTSSEPAAPSGSSGGAPLRRYQGERFSVLLPGAPLTDVLPVRTSHGTVTAHLLTVEESPDEAYIVAYTDYPPTLLLSLEGAVRGAASKVGGQVLGLRRIVYRNEPGRDFRVVAAARGLTVFIRLVVVDHRMYEMELVQRGTHATPPAEFATVLSSLRF